MNLKYADNYGRRVRIIEDQGRMFLCTEEIRGTKHKYVSVELDELANVLKLRELIAQGFAAVDEAFKPK